MGRENGKSSKAELKKAMDKMHPFIHLRKSLFDEMKMLKLKKGMVRNGWYAKTFVVNMMTVIAVSFSLQ